MDGAVGAPQPLRIVGLADDLTGAVALGAELNAGGLAAMVLDAGAMDVPAETRTVVVNTRTRRLGPREASETIERVLEALGPRIGPGTIVIKRIDSGLRGPWPAELRSLGGLIDRRVIAATAAPALGVSVEAGIQHVGGTPASSSHYALDGEGSAGDALVPLMPGSAISVSIEDLTGPAFPETVAPLLARHRTLVCDGSTPEHLAVAARAIVRGDGVIAVGTYGLGRELARAIGEAHAEHPRELAPVLVLVGSDKAVTIRQVDHVRSAGWTVATAGDAGTDLDITDRLRRGERVVLEVGGRTTGTRQARHASVVAAIGARVLAVVPDLRVIIVGGETASAFATAAGVATIEPVAEPWPTIALVRMRSSAGGSTLAIIKSGAQGDPWWLEYAADLVAAWPTPESRLLRPIPPDSGQDG